MSDRDPDGRPERERDASPFGETPEQHSPSGRLFPGGPSREGTAESAVRSGEAWERQRRRAIGRRSTRQRQWRLYVVVPTLALLAALAGFMVGLTTRPDSPGEEDPSARPQLEGQIDRAMRELWMMELMESLPPPP